MNAQQEHNNPGEPPETPLQPRGATPRPAPSRPFRVVKLMLMVYVVSVALYHTIPESLPEAICQSPILSGYFPVCKPDHPRKPVANPDFITLSRLQSRLQYVLEDSASSSMIADGIKGSGTDLRDLVEYVKLSSFVRKDNLGRELKDFVEDTKAAGESLQELSGQVWGAVDQIISLNDQILAVLENSGGPFSSAINFLLPFGQETVDITGGLWDQSIVLLGRKLHELIHRTDHSAELLQGLEERLHTIQDMTVTEEETLREEEEESKSQWFPDKKKSGSRSIRFELLLEVRDRRKHALSQVNSILSQLKHMVNDLRDLRPTVMAPVTAGPSHIPIEAHIKSIRSGTEKLLRGQTRAREIEAAYRQRTLWSNNAS